MDEFEYNVRFVSMNGTEEKLLNKKLSIKTVFQRWQQGLLIEAVQLISNRNKGSIFNGEKVM